MELIPEAKGPPRGARAGLWAVAAKIVGMILAALAVWGVVTSAVGVGPFWRKGWRESVTMLLLLLVVCGVMSFVLWVAWRLWRHWSAGTVRLAIGTAVVLGAAIVWGRMLSFTQVLHFESASAISGGVGVLAITLGAVAYRKLTRAVIRNAELADPRDPHGNPAGHMERVKLFCTALGWSVGRTVASAGMAISRDTGALLGLGGGIALGLTIYKLTLWWMTPVTRPALPPGGFEVM